MSKNRLTNCQRATVGVKIKRAAAQRFADQGKCDHNGEHMIFGQIF